MYHHLKKQDFPQNSIGLAVSFWPLASFLLLLQEYKGCCVRNKVLSRTRQRHEKQACKGFPSDNSKPCSFSGALLSNAYVWDLYCSRGNGEVGALFRSLGYIPVVSASTPHVLISWLCLKMYSSVHEPYIFLI